MRESYHFLTGTLYKIWRIFTPEVPPWRFLVIQKCLFLNKKSSTPQQEKIYSAFLGHKEKNNSIHIYADGSNMEDREWASLVQPQYLLGLCTYSELHPVTTIFSDSQLYCKILNVHTSPMVTEIPTVAISYTRQKCT